MAWRFFLPLIAILPATAETLNYTINWQSGLSVGEASLENVLISAAGASAGPATEGWTFLLTLDAAVPGYTVRDEYRSTADGKFCSEELERTMVRGSARSIEKSTFHRETKTVVRETNGGEKHEIETGECAHDALTFLQLVRRELAQGRLVPHQSVFLGSKYDLQVTYVGNESIRMADGRVEADRVRIASHGPESDLTFEVFFAKDDIRTPLMARLPLSMGTFTVELLQ